MQFQSNLTLLGFPEIICLRVQFRTTKLKKEKYFDKKLVRFSQQTSLKLFLNLIIYNDYRIGNDLGVVHKRRYGLRGGDNEFCDDSAQ